MVVTLSLGEFNLTWMLHTPLTKTLPIGLADSYASMRLEVASAYTLVFLRHDHSAAGRRCRSLPAIAAMRRGYGDER